MAKTSPGEFIRQVRSEASKVAWPTWNETVRTAIMVLIMTALLGATGTSMSVSAFLLLMSLATLFSVLKLPETHPSKAA